MSEVDEYIIVASYSNARLGPRFHTPGILAILAPTAPSAPEILLWAPIAALREPELGALDGHSLSHPRSAAPRLFLQRALPGSIRVDLPSIVSASRHDGTICVLAKAALGVPVRYQISIESAGAARSLLQDLAGRSPHLARASLADTTLSVLDAFAHIGQLLGNALGDRQEEYRVGLRRPSPCMRASASGQAMDVVQIPNNPWITPRKLSLPQSRRSAEALAIDGATMNHHQIAKIVFTSGCSPRDRPRVWKLLFQPRALSEERPRVDDSPISQGEALDLEARIGRDVVRTDRQEPFYYPEISDPSVDIQRPHLASLTRILLKYARLHPEINYLQGMNDIAAVILHVMKDENDAYDVFSSIMETHGAYSIPDGELMGLQLERLALLVRAVDPALYEAIAFSSNNADFFFAHQWLLLLFKRQVGFHAFPAILEVIKTAPIAHYELFVALALIIEARPFLITSGHRLDLTLEYFAQRATTHSIPALLDLADRLCMLIQTMNGPSSTSYSQFSFLSPR